MLDSNLPTYREDYRDRQGILEMDFQVHHPDLIPREKVLAFLEIKLTAQALTLRLRIPSP